jgi:hypothetical protein
MSFAGMLTQKVTVQAIAGRNTYGQPTYAAASTVLKARVESKIELIRDSKGDERVSKTQVATNDPIGDFDRVWLPGRDTTDPNEALTPIALSSAQTPSGSMILYLTFF